MRIGQRTLLGQGGLIALLESAAIRYASENPRNELRVVHQAEAIEQLVFLADIDVQTGIKRLAIFCSRGGTDEIVLKR